MKSIVPLSISERSQIKAAFFLFIKEDKLPKPNYQHDKRQRELEKKKKKEEKKQRKQTTENIKPEEDVNPFLETERPS